MPITLRERLNLQAEWVFDVDGWPTRTKTWARAERHSSADPTQYSAVQLSQRQAGLVSVSARRSDSRPSWICQHPRGMPLAIELAAASLRSLPLSEIERQIGMHLDVLATTFRDVPARHRSLRAAFDHSWDLLTDEERTLFTRVAVFRGGWTLEAAAEVATATLPALAALVDKSLVRLMSAGARATALPHATAESRFTLLEPIREYALEQLALRGEAQALQRSHARYYLALAEAAAAQWDSPAAESIIKQLDITRQSPSGAALRVMAAIKILGPAAGAGEFRQSRPDQRGTGLADTVARRADASGYGSNGRTTASHAWRIASNRTISSRPAAFEQYQPQRALGETGGDAAGSTQRSGARDGAVPAGDLTVKERQSPSTSGVIVAA
jgi:hypothetical protein